MKTSLFIMSLISISAPSLSAKEFHFAEGTLLESRTSSITEMPRSENEKDFKIANLQKLLEQQQRLYDEKILYLEDELQKSKERLVEKSINFDNTKDNMERRFKEETNYLRKELVAKTKTMMEYQRQLEKIKPSEELKDLIKVNTELALELRKSADQLAIINIKKDSVANKLESKPVSGRVPASTSK